MNLTDEQKTLLHVMITAHREGHRSQFDITYSHQGYVELVYKDNHKVAINADRMDFLRLEAEQFIDFDESGPRGKLTAQGLNAFDDEEQIEEDPTNGPENPDPKRVFVIHGRNEKIRKSMFDFLRALELQPMEWGHALSETSEGSPYVGTVLDKALQRARAIIALFTPDEAVTLRQELRPPDDKEKAKIEYQARPNVLFEAGMAMGQCSARTILVEIGKPRPFSDIVGRHVVRFDGSQETRNDLAGRLKNAGCDVNTQGNDWQTSGDFEINFADHPQAQSRSKILEIDAVNLFIGWLQKPEKRIDLRAIAFTDVDKELELPPGTAWKYLEKAGEMCNYKVKQKGVETILFERKSMGAYVGSMKKDRKILY